jgi:hypothetical protein
MVQNRDLYMEGWTPRVNGNEPASPSIFDGSTSDGPYCCLTEMPESVLNFFVAILVPFGEEIIDDRWNENKKDEDNMKYEIQQRRDDETDDEYCQ